MILKPGSSGPEVKILQARLLSAGFDPNGDDGIFGTDTEQAVEDFQRKHRLTVDGRVEWPSGETADALSVVHAAQPAPPAPPAQTAGVPLATATFTAGFEGFSTTPYRDSGGIWTYLFGSTRDPDGNPVTAHTPPGTRELGLQLMRRDLVGADTAVMADVHAALTPEEREALDDLVYNIGLGNFAGSTLLRDINAGRMDLASAEFLRWDQVKGQVLSGLLKRRQAERQLFLQSDGAQS